MLNRIEGCFQRLIFALASNMMDLVCIPKTGLRFCPIFPELRKLLDEAFELAPDGAVYCQRYRRGQNLGTQMNRIIEAAGVKPWPKTFVNLRSSRRTCFPNHVINQWLGHSKEVAEKHYLQITPQHWELAESLTSRRGNAGGNSSANQDASTEITNEKTPANAGVDDCGSSVTIPLAPPAGLEPATNGLTVRCSTN